MNAKSPLYQAVLEGKAPLAKELAQQAVVEGADPKTLLDESMIPAMDEVGRLFEAGEYFVPELLISARAMRAALEVIKPLLTETGAKPVGSVVIGTVKGDLHDIGKNLVAAMLEGGGFEIIDLGVDTEPSKFVQAVRERGVQVVALSALLTTTMPAMKKVIEELEAAGLRSHAKVMVGGAPVTERFAREIGADGYCPSAAGAVVMARGFVGAN
jgi:5-methyltetrahydrofolate--homocysteine methyltransferase